MKKIKFKQQDITDCGAACLASVLAWYGLLFPLARIRQYAGTGKKGTNLLGMIKAAENLGLLAKAVRVNEEYFDSIPCPAIAHLNFQDRWFHFVVIYKISKNKVHIMDPASGELEKWTREKFIKNWSGIILLISPGEHFKKGDKTSSIFQRYLKLLMPHKSILIQALTGAILYSLLGIATSIYVEKLIDFVIPSGNKNLLNLLSIALVAILIFRILIGFIKSLYVLKTGQKIDAMLVLGYYRHLMKLPKQFFDTMRTGEIISRVNDAVKIRHFINNIAIDMMVNILIVTITLLVMISYSLKIGLIVFISIPFYIILYKIYNKINKSTIRKTMEDSAELESGLVESLNGVDTIKYFAAENKFTNRIDQKFVKLLDSSFLVNRNSFIIKNFSDLFSGLILIFIFWIGTKLIFQQALSTGELLSFYTLYNYLAGPLTALLMSNKSIQDAIIASDRLFQIMDLEHEKFSKESISINIIENNNIVFSKVNFQFPNQLFRLEDLNFTTQGGEITAFVGESGSGKSTLFSLIQKFYEIEEGEILVSSNNLKTISKSVLRNNICLVPQKIKLFNDTILQNILLGDNEPDIIKINKIIESIGMKKFIDSLPEGLNTWVREDGTNFSGGEKQKIAIARALYKDPKILLLDEASSALDSVSENYLRNTTIKLKNEGVNVMLVAHRLSSIIHADQIFVLKNGKIVEQGNHKSLLNKKSEYSRLWNLQYGFISQELMTV
jgi:ATP-binding cassette, subfamily C, bacteriocin exporter